MLFYYKQNVIVLYYYYIYFLNKCIFEFKFGKLQIVSRITFLDHVFIIVENLMKCHSILIKF